MIQIPSQKEVQQEMRYKLGIGQLQFLPTKNVSRDAQPESRSGKEGLKMFPMIGDLLELIQQENL